MKIAWPNGARIAVALSFDVDAESTWLGRDPENARRPGVLSQGTYSPKVAVPAILELLERERVPATFFVPGLDADNHPDTVRAIHRAGHEVGHHGYEHVRADPNDPAGEERSFMRAIESLTRLAVRPVGFRSPSWDFTEKTLELLKRERFAYSSNFMDDLYPYLHPGTQLVELPVHWILDDAPFFLFGLGVNQRPIQPASHALEIWREEFEGLFELGGAPYVMTMHPQFIGRPSRLRALSELVRFIKRHDGVWFATCRAIADAARAQLSRPDPPPPA